MVGYLSIAIMWAVIILISVSYSDCHFW
jgi:hypothetical protein